MLQCSIVSAINCLYVEKKTQLNQSHWKYQVRLVFFHCLGYFQDAPGLESVDDCLPCSPGFYCEHYGRTSVTGRCTEGFYCYSAANSSSPMDGTTGQFSVLIYYTTNFFGTITMKKLCKWFFIEITSFVFSRWHMSRRKLLPNRIELAYTMWKRHIHEPHRRSWMLYLSRGLLLCEPR